MKSDAALMCGLRYKDSIDEKKVLAVNNRDDASTSPMYGVIEIPNPRFDDDNDDDDDVSPHIENQYLQPVPEYGPRRRTVADSLRLCSRAPAHGALGASKD